MINKELIEVVYNIERYTIKLYNKSNYNKTTTHTTTSTSIIQTLQYLPNQLKSPEEVAGECHAEGRQLEAEGEGVVGGVQGQPPGVSAIGIVQSHVASLDHL